MIAIMTNPQTMLITGLSIGSSSEEELPETLRFDDARIAELGREFRYITTAASMAVTLTHAVTQPFDNNVTTTTTAPPAPAAIAKVLDKITALFIVDDDRQQAEAEAKAKAKAKAEATAPRTPASLSSGAAAFHQHHHHHAGACGLSSRDTIINTVLTVPDRHTIAAYNPQSNDNNDNEDDNEDEVALVARFTDAMDVELSSSTSFSEQHRRTTIRAMREAGQPTSEVNRVVARKLKTMVRTILSKPITGVVDDADIIRSFRQIRPLFPRFKRMMAAFTKIAQVNSAIHLMPTYTALINAATAARRETAPPA